MKAFWNRIRVFFKDSETLVWARVQMLFGVIMMTDLSPILPAKYLPWYVIISGVVTELSRRAREPRDLGVRTVADLDTVMVPVKVGEKMQVNEANGMVVIEKNADLPAAVVERAEKI